MAEGASASSEGAFHTQDTSLSGAAEGIAEAAWTGAPASTDEAAWIEGLRLTGERPRWGTEGRHRLAAKRKNAGSATTVGDLRWIEGTC